jgi:hypothetical protein
LIVQLRLLSFCALVALGSAASPALAQLATEIEGPMETITAFPSAVTDPDTGESVIGEIRLMDVLIKVRADALIHTPTAVITLSQLATGPMPGRTEQGFHGGTGIITGESIGGVIFADDVFSDLFEHVVVGEATNAVTVGTAVRATVNNMQLRRSSDPRMPAAAPINGFGFRIDTTTIEPGSLLAAEGYYSARQRVLYYHTLEADDALLLRPDITEVSILRAECRIRGGGRDELSVRGGVHNRTTAAAGTVQIQRPNAAGTGWVNVATATAVGDPTTANPALGQPEQGEYRLDARNLTFLNGCPSQIRARYAGETGVAFATFAPDAR